MEKRHACAKVIFMLLADSRHQNRWRMSDTMFADNDALRDA